MTKTEVYFYTSLEGEQTSEDQVRHTVFSEVKYNEQINVSVRVRGVCAATSFSLREHCDKCCNLCSLASVSVSSGFAFSMSPSCPLTLPSPRLVLPLIIEGGGSRWLLEELTEPLIARQPGVVL